MTTPNRPPSAADPLTTQEQEGLLTDGEGKIAPWSFPKPKVDPDFIETLAEGIRTAGGQIGEIGNDITTSWGGLTHCYESPGHDYKLYAVLNPVARDGDSVSSGMNQAANALEDFASAAQSLRRRWDILTEDAETFRRRIDEEGDDWDDGTGFLWLSDNPNVAENRALYERGVALIEEYEQAERDCANLINLGVSDRTRFEAMPSDGEELDPDVFYHGYEDDLADVATEWDSGPAGTDLPWWGDAGSAVWDFGVGAVEGTGAMLGAHTSEGWFTMSWGDALYEYHEDNIQSALGLVGLYDAESDSYGWAGLDGVGESWKELAHSVVPWEEWGDRPGYVIGTALLNIGATVGGAVLTATGVGATVGVPLMLWRGASILDGMGPGRGGSGTDLDLSGTSAQVSNANMQVIKAYMDQLVNPNYADTGGGPDSGPGEGISGGRTNTQQIQQGDKPTGSGSTTRRDEDQEPTPEGLQAFEEVLNDPELRQVWNDKYGPAFGERDPHAGGNDTGLWEADPGDGRNLELVGANGPNDSTATGASSGGGQDNRYDLSSAEDPGSLSRTDGDTTESGPAGGRSPMPVTNQDAGGSGNSGTGGDHSTGGRDTSSGTRRGAEEGGTSTRSGSFGPLGPGNPTTPGSDGPGGAPDGQGAGRGFDDDTSDRASQADKSGDNHSRNVDNNQSNPWDKEWNNDNLNSRYRPPVVPSERIHILREGDSGPPAFPNKGERFAVGQKLEPNSVWDVKGRGRFFTNDRGDIFHIDTEHGNKYSHNQELKHPRADMKYAVDVIEHSGKKFHFETDKASNTTHAHGNLHRLAPDEEGGTSLNKKNDLYRTSDQRKEGKIGKKTYPDNHDKNHDSEWDGGHFFGTGFGGSGHKLNLFAQLRELNQSRSGTTVKTNFFKLESDWRQHLEKGSKVKVTFDANYTEGNPVPTSVQVRYSVDGGPLKTINYVNTPDLKSESPTPRPYPVRFPDGAPLGAGVGAALMHAGATQPPSAEAETEKIGGFDDPRTTPPGERGNSSA